MSALNSLRGIPYSNTPHTFFASLLPHNRDLPFFSGLLPLYVTLLSVHPQYAYHTDHRMAQVGADPNATMSDPTAKYNTITDAANDMVAFAKEFVDLESNDPAEMMKKQAVLHFFLTSFLSVQYVKQAFALLDEITTVYGCEPSHRYYDPFTNYFAVRGKCGRSSKLCTLIL